MESSSLQHGDMRRDAWHKRFAREGVAFTLNDTPSYFAGLLLFLLVLFSIFAVALVQLAERAPVPNDLTVRVMLVTSTNTPGASR